MDAVLLEEEEEEDGVPGGGVGSLQDCAAILCWFLQSQDGGGSFIAGLAVTQVGKDPD